MIEMKLTLHTPWEVAVINEGWDIILKARAAQAGAQTPNAATLAAMAAAEAGDTVPLDEAANEARVDAVMQNHPEVVADISPVGVAVRTAPTPAPVTEAEMETAVKAALDKHGVADVRDVITNITGGKRWKEAGAEAWPAIKTALEEMPEPVAK